MWKNELDYGEWAVDVRLGRSKTQNHKSESEQEMKEQRIISVCISYRPWRDGKIETVSI
jgi:hypothetical protein